LPFWGAFHHGHARLLRVAVLGRKERHAKQLLPLPRGVRVPEVLLSRSDLRELGLERRAVDVVFRECPVIQLPGYSRPLVRVRDCLALLDGAIYCDRCGAYRAVTDSAGAGSGGGSEI